MNPAKGQASLQGNMRKAPWEVHEWDLYLEDIFKQVKKAEEEQLVQTTMTAIFTWRDALPRQNSIQTLFHFAATDNEHVELRNSCVQSRMVVLLFHILFLSTSIS